MIEQLAAKKTRVEGDLARMQKDTISQEISMSADDCEYILF